MAIIIKGKSKCPICNEVMKTNDDLVAFPHFIDDVKSPLYFFSDRGFHKDCFDAHKLSEDVIIALTKKGFI